MTALSGEPHQIQSVTTLLAGSEFTDWFARNNAVYPIFCAYVVVHEHMHTCLGVVPAQGVV